MIKHYLNVGNYKYCVEYIPYNELPDMDKKEQSFVMIRNFNIMNDIVMDNNIYFIPKDLIDINKETLKSKLKENYEENDNLLFDNIVFPSYNAPLCYGAHYLLFNDTFIDNDLFKEYSVYHLLEKKYNDNDTYTLNEKKVKCNLVKIYHPHIKSTNKLIVHIKNVINNITFHYICNRYENFNINSTDEFRYENNIYSEYIYVYIPDIFDLFGVDFQNKKKDDNNIDVSEITSNGEFLTYFKEDLNNVNMSDENSKEFKTNAILNYNGEQYIGLGLLTQLSKIVETEDKKLVKQYIKNNNVYDRNFLNKPIDVILFPYSYIDESNKIYILDDNLTPISQTFVNEYKFKINAICDFDNDVNENNAHQLSVIVNFDYPDKEIFESIYKKSGNPLTEAYCYFNGISKKDRIGEYNAITNKIEGGIYTQSLVELKEKYKEELDEISKLQTSYITTKRKKQMYGLNYKYVSDEEALEHLKELRMESFIEEYIEEFGVNIDFFGMKIEIATDENFKHIIYDKTYKISRANIINWLNDKDDEPLDLFGILGDGTYRFSLSNIFDDWNQLPKYLIIHTTFIDRLLGINLIANPLVITKEKFKYMINHKEHYRLMPLYDKNKNMKEYKCNDDASFNFINNVNCVINKNASNKYVVKIITNILNKYKDNNKLDDSTLNNILNEFNELVRTNLIIDENNEKYNLMNTNKQIIYKPFYYKVQTLNNIILRENQIQNVALDLHQYMTKVQTFRLKIEDIIYDEVSRNNNYVIFKINANNINDIEGKYNIYNENNDYISYGVWKIS